MITLTARIAELLGGLDAAVFYFYPQNWVQLPAVSWRESGNRELARADGQPHLAELTKLKVTTGSFSRPLCFSQDT